MRILLLGKKGQLGWELNRTLAALGELVCLDYPEVDFAQTQELYNRVKEAKPDLIINAAAYTAVDRAENEVETCRLVNAAAPGILAEAALHLRAGFIHYSTDYVFDGKKGAPYQEGDKTNPLNVYGQTKLDGEKAVQAVGGAYLILRTSWVYSMRKGGFITKLLQWAQEQETLRLVTDQVGNPTWARMLAEVTAQLVAKGGIDVAGFLTNHQGLYHLAGGGHASRYEWGKAAIDLAVQRQAVKPVEIKPALTEEFPTPAMRPLFSALNCDLFTTTFSLQLPPWKEALRLAMDRE